MSDSRDLEFCELLLKADLLVERIRNAAEEGRLVVRTVENRARGWAGFVLAESIGSAPYTEASFSPFGLLQVQDPPPKLDDRVKQLGSRINELALRNELTPLVLMPGLPTGGETKAFAVATTGRDGRWYHEHLVRLFMRAGHFPGSDLII